MQFRVIRGLGSALGEQRQYFLTAVGLTHPAVVGGNPGKFPDPSWSPTFSTTDGWVSNTDCCISKSARVTVVGWVREKQGTHRPESCPCVPFCSVHINSCAAGSPGWGDEREADHRPWEFLVYRPGGAEVKDPPASVGDARDSGAIPGSGSSPGETTPGFLPGKSYGQSSLMGCSP